MFRLFLLLTAWAIIGASTVVYAKEALPDFSQFESKLLSMQNPFESQLPEKPVVVKLPDKPESDPHDDDKKKTEPTRPETPPEIPLPTTVISGIIWDSDRPQAIINENVVSEGDTILGIKIISIRKLGIDGLFHGRSVTLKP